MFKITVTNTSGSKLNKNLIAKGSFFIREAPLFFVNGLAIHRFDCVFL